MNHKHPFAFRQLNISRIRIGVYYDLKCSRYSRNIKSQRFVEGGSAKMATQFRIEVVYFREVT
jgi:hypothetical protein